MHSDLEQKRVLVSLTWGSQCGFIFFKWLSGYNAYKEQERNRFELWTKTWFYRSAPSRPLFTLEQNIWRYKYKLSFMSVFGSMHTTLRAIIVWLMLIHAEQSQAQSHYSGLLVQPPKNWTKEKIDYFTPN